MAIKFINTKTLFADESSHGYRCMMALLRKLELHVERLSAALEFRMLKSIFLTLGMITCCPCVCLSSTVNGSGEHKSGISPGCNSLATVICEEVSTIL